MLSHEQAPTDAAGPDMLDATALAQLRELDPSGANRLLERVVQAFDTSTARLLPQLEQAGADADLVTARHAVHTLKSSSASLGALRLSRLCAELEQQIRSDSIVALESQIVAIVAEAALVKVALARLVGAAA
jgi:HPt (histidine-containing phosphotransfer) domain-containing protein